MSSWLSFERFFHSRTATWCRYGLFAFGTFGVASDYYLTHYYHAFEPSEGRQYIVDWSPIGKPRCQMLLIPSNYYTNYSPWTPRNGDVVLAREVEDEPNYLQLLNGRFVERQTCGVTLMRPVEEVAESQREEQLQREELLSSLSHNCGTMRCCASRLRQAVAGVAESQYFASMRAEIMRNLRTHTHDRSLAGRVDPQIAAVVDYINGSFSQYVTSSSCGGRVSLFHKGTRRASTATLPQEATEPDESSAPTGVCSLERRKRGSFGRGTLFQSHDPLPADALITARDSMVRALEEFWAWRQAQPSAALLQGSEVLQLKFEPMILHVLCADVEAAAELLKCGSESGQMSSGIVSCSRGTKTHRKITCCITSPLCVDVPLFAHDTWCISPADFGSTVWATFLTASLTRVNELFAENATRRERFLLELHTRAEKAAVQQQQRHGRG